MAKGKRGSDPAAIEYVRVIFTPRQAGLFDVRLEGQKQVIATSRQPLLEAARALLPLALCNPSLRIVGRHDGQNHDSIAGVLVDLARMTCVERAGRQPSLEEWRPHQFAEGID